MGVSVRAALSGDPALFAIVQLSLVVSLSAVLLAALIGIPFGAFIAPAVSTTPAVEYFHAGFGHYFVTADPAEIAGLDAGAYGGVLGVGTDVLAGGGLKTGQAVGVTDELGRKILDTPISVPDLHATIHCALGINPEKFLYDEDRPVPITDRGQPVRAVFG